MAFFECYGSTFLAAGKREWFFFYFLFFYSGRNGWWQYDDRSNAELERAWEANKKTFEVLIAGFVYVIDLEKMEQVRRNDRSRKRRICRNPDDDVVRKGVAGIMTDSGRRPSGDSLLQRRTSQDTSTSVRGKGAETSDGGASGTQQTE